MKNLIKKSIQKFLKILNLKIINLSNYEIISRLPRSFYVYALLTKLKTRKSI